MDRKKKRRVLGELLALPSVLALTLMMMGCAEGYESPNGFDSGVRNTQMESPDSVHMEINAAGDQATITWPLVKGAESYEVSFLNVDDPENPQPVDGYDKKMVDGPKMTISVKEDTRYRMEMRTIGNKSLGNTDEDAPKVHDMSTLVPSLATIPSGVDIYEWWQENNPLDSAYIGQEVAVELEANGRYTMSGQVDFQGWQVTFRGDKLRRPIVSINGGSFAMYAGVKFKFINFDMSESTAGSFLYMSKDNLPEKIMSQNLGYMRNGSPINNIYIVKNPVYISDCWFKNVPQSFVHDNSINTAWWYFTINRCIIQLKISQSGKHFFNFHQAGKCVKNFTISNSTLYNTESSASYFMKLQNKSNANPEKVFGNSPADMAKANEVYKNSTIIGVFRENNWKNMHMEVNQTINIDHCILVDIYRINKGVTGSTIKTYRFNVWWVYPESYGYSDSSTMGDWNIKDASGMPLAAQYDPQFPAGMIYQELNLEAENAGVNFTPGEYEVIQMGAGDPLWLEK